MMVSWQTFVQPSTLIFTKRLKITLKRYALSHHGWEKRPSPKRNLWVLERPITTTEPCEPVGVRKQQLHEVGAAVCFQRSRFIFHPNWQTTIFVQMGDLQRTDYLLGTLFCDLILSSYASDDSSVCVCLRLFWLCTMVNHHQTTIWRLCFTFSNHLVQIQAMQMMMHQRNTFQTTPEVRNGEWFLCPLAILRKLLDLFGDGEF